MGAPLNNPKVEIFRTLSIEEESLETIARHLGSIAESLQQLVAGLSAGDFTIRKGN